MRNCFSALKLTWRAEFLLLPQFRTRKESGHHSTVMQRQFVRNNLLWETPFLLHFGPFYLFLLFFELLSSHSMKRMWLGLHRRRQELSPSHLSITLCYLQIPFWHQPRSCQVVCELISGGEWSQPMQKAQACVRWGSPGDPKTQLYPDGIWTSKSIFPF